MINIKEIAYDDVSVYNNLVAKEHVSMGHNENAIWFGAYEGDKLQGFCCVVIKGRTARFKSDYVFRDFRGKGIYNKLFAHRYDYTLRRKGLQKITAFCTNMSIGTFMLYGFKPIRRNANNITFVEKMI